MGRIIRKQALLFVLLWQRCTSPKREIYVYIGEAIKCRVLIDTQEYQCMHDRLAYSRKGCVQGHVTSLKFSEISDNIPEAVQDIDIVAMENKQ